MLLKRFAKDWKEDLGWFMTIRIDTYFDLTCDGCNRSWSTDFEMGMVTNKAYLRRAAYAAGWKCKNGKTLCPECVKNVK